MMRGNAVAAIYGIACCGDDIIPLRTNPAPVVRHQLFFVTINSVVTAGISIVVTTGMQKEVRLIGWTQHDRNMMAQ